MIMSMRRAGWTWPAWHTMCTKEGYVLNLKEVCPMDVAAMLRRDVQSCLWAVWTAKDEDNSLMPAPYIAPAVSQLKARGLPKHAKNAAKKVFIGGSWTMSKL